LTKKRRLFYVFDPVARRLYREPAIFGSAAPAPQSWEPEQLLAIDSLFLPENYSELPGVPDWSGQDLRHRVSRIRAPAVVSHVSAARLLGLPLPFRIATDPRLHVTISRSRARSHQIEIQSHLGDLIDSEIVATNGLCITTPARIVADLAGVLNLSELNVLLDAAQAPHIDPLFDRVIDHDNRGLRHSPSGQFMAINPGSEFDSEFVRVLLRRKRYPGRTRVVRLLGLRSHHLLPYSDVPWQSFVAATIASEYNTTVVSLSPDQLAIPAHNVIMVQPWHFADDRQTSMSIASTITALRSFGWCADSVSYRDLLSVDSLLKLYAQARNRPEFAHMRLSFQRAQRS